MTACRRARHGVIPDEHGGVEAQLHPFDHRAQLGSAAQQLGRRVQLFGEKVPHEPVAVVHQDPGGAGGERALDGGVGLAGHQPAESVILSGMPGIDGVGLVFVDHTGHPFHVDGDVDPHCLSRDGGHPAPGSAAWQQPEGRTMRGWTLGIGVAAAALACGPHGDSADQRPAAAGPAVHRLALRQPVREAVESLLARHAPDLRQRVRSGQLRRPGGHPPRAGSRGRSTRRSRPRARLRIYSRTATFDRSRHTHAAGVDPGAKTAR